LDVTRVVTSAVTRDNDVARPQSEHRRPIEAELLTSELRRPGIQVKKQRGIAQNLSALAHFMR